MTEGEAREWRKGEHGNDGKEARDGGKEARDGGKGAREWRKGERRSDGEEARDGGSGRWRNGGVQRLAPAEGLGDFAGGGGVVHRVDVQAGRAGGEQLFA